MVLEAWPFAMNNFDAERLRQWWVDDLFFVQHSRTTELLSVSVSQTLTMANVAVISSYNTCSYAL